MQVNFADIIRRPLNKQDQMFPDVRTGYMIKPTADLTPHRRLELYAQQYWWRIRSAFDDDFTTVSTILGSEKYELIRNMYLEQYPSQSYTLRNIGARFVSFLSHLEMDDPDLKKQTIQAAQYDWGRVITFDAQDYPPLTREIVLTRNFSKRILKLQPFVYQLEMSFELPKHDDNLPHAKSNVKPVIINESPFFLYRLDNRLYLRKSNHNEALLAKEFVRGSSLHKLFGKYHKLDPNEIHAYFKNWFDAGWLYC